MNILHITFDYGDIYKNKYNNIFLSRKSKTLWGTGSLETQDDIFFINNKYFSNIVVIAGSRYSNKNKYFDEEGYYIIRDKYNIDRQYYNKFIAANSSSEAEQILIEYNSYITKKTLDAIDKINTRRLLRGYSIIKFDLILTPTSRFTILSALHLKQLFKIPLISTLHVNEEELQNIESFRLPWSDIILKYDHITKSQSDYLIAKNNEIFKIIKSINKNVVEINNDILVPSKRITKLKRNNSVLYVGRLSFEKGIDRLYKIAKLLGKHNIDIHICGQTLGLDPNIEVLFHKIIKLPNVKYHGYIDKSKLYKIMQQSKIIILPSRTEVFNQAILEGGYYGCIPISTNVGSAETCISSKDNIIKGKNENEIINNFINRILAELQYYDINIINKLYNEYKKYNTNQNKYKKFTFLKKINNGKKSI